MKYAHLMAYVARTLWAIEPGKLQELLGVLAYRAAGHEFTAEEIQARIGNGAGEAVASVTDMVGVVPIRGVLANRMGGMDESSGGASAERIGAMIDAVAADPRVKTILYDVDSPGGTVPGIQELAAKMFALRGQKKQIAQVNDLAASAGYWLASQADEIVSVPSGRVGSIGVFAVHEDLTAALEKEGVKLSVMSAGEYKTEGAPWAALSEDARAFVQAQVDEAYGQFVRDVARGRGVTPAAVRNGFGQGRALAAKDAKAAGMIDRIATMEETLARAVGRSRVGPMRAEDATIPLLSDVEPVPLAAVETGEPDRRARSVRLL